MKKSDLQAFEVQKIYDEIHQLRNQQCLITLAAITFFGATAAWSFDASIVFDDKCLSEGALPKPLGSFCFALEIGLLLILGVLFYWLSALSKVIARFSIYLELRNLSIWEKHYSIYDSILPRQITQTKAMTYVFLALGVLCFLIPVSLGALSDCYKLDIKNVWFIIVCFIWISYMFVVIQRGLCRLGRENRDEAKARWDEVKSKFPDDWHITMKDE